MTQAENETLFVNIVPWMGCAVLLLAIYNVKKIL